MKKKWKVILTHIAVGLGVIAFWVVKTIMAVKVKKDAELFDTKEVLPKGEKELLYKEMGVMQETHEERVEAIKKAVEENTREEIIHAFKKSFGVGGDDTSNVGGSGSAP